MDKLFYNVLELSWQAGLIALAVMAVRLALRRRVSRRAVCWLWALVALRLMLPLSLTAESPVSLQAEESPVSRAFYAMEAAPDAEKGTAPATPAPGAAQPVEESRVRQSRRRRCGRRCGCCRGCGSSAWGAWRRICC